MFTRFLLSLVVVSVPLVLQAESPAKDTLCETLNTVKMSAEARIKSDPVGQKGRSLELSCEDKVFMRVREVGRTLDEVESDWKEYLAKTVNESNCKQPGLAEAIKDGWKISYKNITKAGEVYEHLVNCDGVK